MTRKVGQRIYFARVINGRCTLAEFGRRVAEIEGRPRPYAPQTVSEWEKGNRSPTLQTLTAIARVSGVRQEWLAFETGLPQVA